MAVSYTTDTLVARARRAAQLNSTNRKLSDAELLQIADECIQSMLWPLVRKSIQDYALTETIVSYAPASAANPDCGIQRLPPRCSASTIAQVAVSTPNGSWKLPHIDASETADYGDALVGSLKKAALPAAYALFGDKLRIVPAPDATQVQLRIMYERRPSRLVAVSECALIASAVIASDLDVTCTGTIPATFTNNRDVDLVRGSPQQTDPIADDYRINSVVAQVIDLSTGNSTTAAGAAEADIRAGDFVCLAGETCVFPLPDVFWPVAIAATAAAALNQCGYVGEASSMQEGIDAQLQVAMGHIQNRVRKQPVKVFRKNGGLRSGWGGRPWNWP